MAVRVVIYDSVIQAHFTPAGDVGKNAAAVGRSAEGIAKAIVGHRTGVLAGSINAGHHPGGRLYYNLFLNANAFYAQWVEHGTGDVALAPGQFRALKPYPAGGHPRTTVIGSKKHPRFLRGQKGQHYLSDGMAGGLQAHGYPVSGAELRRGQEIQRRL